MNIFSLRGEKSNITDSQFINNRNVDTVNVVVSRVYDLTSTQHVYTHFIIKYIYEYVIKYFWWPTNILIAALFLISIIYTVRMIQLQIVNPLRNMSLVAYYIITKNEKKEE